MPDEISAEAVARNVQHTRECIAEAARRSGRAEDDICLVAVSKYLPPDSPMLDALADAGCNVFGESRPQHFLDKLEIWPRASDVEWHMIGHLQRNKVRKVLPHVAMIHSVDSLRLLEAIDRIAEEEGLAPRVLLEVNISGDASKHGFSPVELEQTLDAAAKFTHVQVQGLMGMSGLYSDAEAARWEFASLRELRDRCRADCPDNVVLNELSMGMSRDYEIAIEEGATLVRVGSSLYRE